MITDLHSQLEAEKQYSELAKVSERWTTHVDGFHLVVVLSPQVEISELTARLQAMHQQVRVCRILTPTVEKLV